MKIIDNLNSIDFQQTIHYIGGSTVKSLLRKAQKGLGTEAWSEIYDCMNKKFVVGLGLPGPGGDIEAFTDSMDRGGLKHINDKMWSFLIALSGILKEKEGDDGGILHEDVFAHVIKDDVMMFLWNDITEGFLKEDVDVLLLKKFCEFFTNTWLRGVILRRKNALLHVSRDKSSLRSRLSR